MGIRSDPSWEAVLNKTTVTTVERGASELLVATQDGQFFALDAGHALGPLLAIEKALEAVESIYVGPSRIFMGPYRLIREGQGFRTTANFIKGLTAASLPLKNGNVFVAGYEGWEIRNAEEDSVLAKWTSQAMGRIQALAELPDKILIGTNNGLFAVEEARTAAEMMRFEGVPFRHRVSDIKVDQGGNCWIATLGNGLFCLQGSQLHVIGEAEGLRSMTVHRIDFDAEGRLWIATNFGLRRLEYEATSSEFEVKEIKTLTNLNGLPSNFVRDVSYWKGKIYMASEEGLHCFDPALMDRVLPVPAIRLGPVRVNGAEVDWQASEGFAGPVDLLEIQFSAYSALKSKQQPLYRSRLLGPERDSTWMYSNARRQEFRNLAPGQHRFEIETCNARGEWTGVPTRLWFEVGQIWWKVWMIPGILVLLALGLGGWIWWRSASPSLAGLETPIAEASQGNDATSEETGSEMRL
ncbi:MAG: hypothetical protein AAF570_23875, partial [Bacteroidota bacterium]